MFDVLENILGSEELKRLALPTAEATSLPPGAYTSEEFARLENERIFPRVWVQVGFAHEIRDPGDAVPITVAGQPIILVRNKERAIKAFYNSCRHRGTQLIDKPCRRKKDFRCPYHSWTYDLDGQLKSTPHFSGYQKDFLNGHDASELGLLPVRCERWHDWVFVNLDGNAPPLDVYMKPFTDLLKKYDLGLMRHDQTQWFEIKANWKLVQENFAEVYHFSTIHPTYNEFAPFQKWEQVMDGPCLCNFTDTSQPELWGEVPLPRFTGVSRSERSGKNLLLFPHFKMSIGADWAVTGIEFPQAPGLVHQRWDLYFVGGAALRPEFAKARKAVDKANRDINEQDVKILESVQKGLAASAPNGGVYSPAWEKSVQHFQRLVVENLQ